MAEQKTVVEGKTVTIPCLLKDTTLELPEWRFEGKISAILTNQGSKGINQDYKDRLKYDTNKRDLILTNAKTSDSGEYKCSYASRGNATFTLTVNKAPDEATFNAEFKYLDDCYSVGKTLRLEAVYTGEGIPDAVQWSYSGGTATNLIIDTSTCAMIAPEPAGFPSAARITYECPTTDASLAADTYRLTVTELTSDELKQSWGATFTPPSGNAPAANQIPIPVCSAPAADDDNGLSTGAIVGIVIGSVVSVIIIVVVILAIMGKLRAPTYGTTTTSASSGEKLPVCLMGCIFSTVIAVVARFGLIG